jgi:hypothetical protein
MQVFEAARAELEELQRQWATFETQDQPEFSSWYSRTFSSLMAEIQTCAYQLYEKQLLLGAVMAEAEARGISYKEAYENIQNGNAMNREEADEAAARELFEESLRADGLDPEEMNPAEYEDAFARFKMESQFDAEPGSEEFFEDEEDEGFFRFDDETSSSKRESSYSDPVREKSLKEAFWKLAKRLHPDAVGTLSAAAQELWLKAQAAYERGDLTTLLTMLGPQEGEQAKADQVLSMSDLLKKATEFLSMAVALRKRLKSARRDRAWGFSGPTRGKKRKKVYATIRKELEQELAETQAALEALEEFIEQFLDQAA